MWAETVLVLRDGNLLPNAIKWDDQMISDILITENQINSEKAVRITRSLREDIERMGLNEVQVPLLEKIIDAKMLEYGFTKARPIHLHQLLVKRENGLNLSANALRVLKKRYLRKDANGNVVETPDEMFRRVSRTIAGAEDLYDQDDYE